MLWQLLRDQLAPENIQPLSDLLSVLYGNICIQQDHINKLIRGMFRPFNVGSAKIYR